MRSNPYLIPDGNIMHTDVFLRHVEQKIRKFDVQKQRQIFCFPAYIQKMQQTCLHTWQGGQQGSKDEKNTQRT